jgi:hypothetical protein
MWATVLLLVLLLVLALAAVFLLRRVPMLFQAAPVLFITLGLNPSLVTEYPLCIQLRVIDVVLIYTMILTGHSSITLSSPLLFWCFLSSYYDPYYYSPAYDQNSEEYDEGYTTEQYSSVDDRELVGEISAMSIDASGSNTAGNNSGLPSWPGSKYVKL